MLHACRFSPAAMQPVRSPRRTSETDAHDHPLTRMQSLPGSAETEEDENDHQGETPGESQSVETLSASSPTLRVSHIEWG